jgi:hypothetical protein
MKILLGGFIAKVSRRDTSKPTVGNDSLQKIMNVNGVTLVKFATSKISQSKLQCSHIAHMLGHLQMGKPTVRFTVF